MNKHIIRVLLVLTIVPAIAFSYKYMEPIISGWAVPQCFAIVFTYVYIFVYGTLEDENS